MNKRFSVIRRSASRLFGLLACYGIIVFFVFSSIPAAAESFQADHQALSGSARLAAIAGFLVVVTAWQVLDKRDRLRRAAIQVRQPLSNRNSK